MRTPVAFVSYRRFSSQFQFSLSGVTLVYLSQWCIPLREAENKAKVGPPKSFQNSRSTDFHYLALCASQMMEAGVQGWLGLVPN